jgi:hypothetical protein
MPEGAKRGRPKFHVIQVLAQLFESFDQVPNNQLFCRFRHCYWPLSRIGHFLLLGLRIFSRCRSPSAREPFGANFSNDLEPLGPETFRVSSMWGAVART